MSLFCHLFCPNVQEFAADQTIIWHTIYQIHPTICAKILNTFDVPVSSWYDFHDDLGQYVKDHERDHEPRDPPMQVKGRQIHSYVQNCDKAILCLSHSGAKRYTYPEI